MRSGLENSEDVRLEKGGEENNAATERKVNEYESKALGGECSILVHNKLLTKLKDPSSFSIHRLIENISIDRALCDLVSSVSLIPYFIFKRLDLGQLQSISIRLQLANSFVKYHLGILEDVPIKVGDLCMLNGFVVLDIVEDAYTQIILGRLFLATTGCKIDVKGGS